MTPKQLQVPPPPPLAVHLWGYFVDLSATRASGGFGPSRITRAEIRAWEEDEAIHLERWERRALLMLDAAYIASFGKKSPDTTQDDEEEAD